MKLLMDIDESEVNEVNEVNLMDFESIWILLYKGWAITETTKSEEKCNQIAKESTQFEALDFNDFQAWHVRLT
jgi:hypothetical protein